MSQTAPTLSQKLAPCTARRNCVCSDDLDPRYAVDALTFTDSAQSAWHRLCDIIACWPRLKLVETKNDYLRCECRSRVFGFVDDLEFLLVAECRYVAVRSAARVGFWDLGVNRRRVEAIRRVFTRQGG